MSTASDFRDLQSRLAGSDRAVWLGRLVWYSVSQTKISHNELFRSLVNCNLGGYAPRPPSDVDVFRRVCSAAQRKRIPTGTEGVYENYLVRDVPMDDNDITRKVLVRETVNTGSLEYHTELCTLDFNKKTAWLQISCTQTDVVANQIAEEIRTNFNDAVGTLNSYGVRELIRKILDSLNAVNVRGKSGGVYFVGEGHGSTLDNLEQFAGLMPGVVLFHSLPLLDDSKQREMLRRAYESESADEIDRLMDEIAEAQKKGKKISAEKLDTYMSQLDGFKRKSKEYSSLLETTLDTAASRIQVFQLQCMQLMSEL